MPNLNDVHRLSAFDAELLSTAPDDILQSVVQQASDDAHTPIALVSLVMRRVQFFRAQIGLPPDLEQSRATSRQLSFCQFVVEQDQPFIVSDAPTDQRVPQELVRSYGIGSYLGVPLHYGGEVIGSLCVIDVKPRQFDPLLIGALQTLAKKVVARLMELHQQHADVDETPASTDIRSAILHLLRDIRILDRAVLELNDGLREAEQADIHRLLHSSPSWKTHLTNMVALSMEISANVHLVEQGAQRVLRILEHTHTPVDPDVREAVLLSGRSLLRAAAEAGTLPRLLQGLMRGTLSTDLLERNAAVLRESLQFDTDVRANLHDLIHHLHTLSRRLKLNEELDAHFQPLLGSTASQASNLMEDRP